MSLRTEPTLAQLESGRIIGHGSRVRRERSEKWFRLATLVLGKVLERAQAHQPPGRSQETIRYAAAERFDEVVDDEVTELLEYLAFFGYLGREVEEGWKWTEVGSDWIRNVLATGSEVAGVKTHTFEEMASWIAVHGCDRTREHEPPGFCVDAIDAPLWAVRDFVMARFCQIQVEVAALQGLGGPDGLPPGTEMVDFMAAWRIGVLVRATERSALVPA